VGKVTFTVFTPTYNRARTLPRAFDSLTTQTLQDFEWLVVDDGSTDGTADLIDQWRCSSSFPIRYFRQPHSGKWRAHNRAIEQADGELFITLDSDDACVPTALQRLHEHWSSIPSHQRGSFCGVWGLCCDELGTLIGDRFPQHIFDSSFTALRYRHKIRGEKWGCLRTDLLRATPFPEIVGVTHIPEAVVWDRLAHEYDARFVNECFLTYWSAGQAEADRLSSMPDMSNGAAYAFLHSQILNDELEWLRWAPLQCVASAIRFARFSLDNGVSPARQLDQLHAIPARALWVVGLPLGFLVHGYKRLRSC
jgi:glycosyltransferase involved in cell wall biosynthesis